MITQERLKEALSYDPETGIFTNRVNRSSRARAGAEAGSFRPDGYRYIQVDGKKYLAHRMAFLYMVGRFPNAEIDHINHVKDDNSWGNLREASHGENGKNQSMPVNNTSGVIGVGWNRRNKKWLAQIKVDGKKTHLGYFENKPDAIAARKAADTKHRFHQNHGR